MDWGWSVKSTLQPTFRQLFEDLSRDDVLKAGGKNASLRRQLRLLKDGRLELDTNPVENQIRPIALPRRNALFPGHEVGAENWATLASLIATCKTSDVKATDYIARTMRAILDGHPGRRIEDLMPRMDRSEAKLRRVGRRRSAY